MGEEIVPKNLTKSDKVKVIEYLRDGKKLRAAIAGALSKKKKSARARSLANGDEKTVKKGILDLFAQLPLERRLKARQIICIEYDFCNSRRDTGYVLGLIPILSGIFAGPFSVPLSVLVAIIIYRPFNILCECGPGEIDEAGRKLIQRLFGAK